MTENKDKIRHTFHFHEATINKLRDVVSYIQKHPDEFNELELPQIDNLSRFVENATLQKIRQLEDLRGRRFKKRRPGAEVHFGRPPVTHAA